MRLLHLSKCNNRIFVRNNLLNQIQPNNPLHGVKLAEILEALVDNYGWEHMAFKVNINCFKIDPSIKSSLTFLRKTDWARKKVEQLYIELLEDGEIKA